MAYQTKVMTVEHGSRNNPCQEVLFVFHCIVDARDRKKTYQADIISKLCDTFKQRRKTIFTHSANLPSWNSR